MNDENSTLKRIVIVAGEESGDVHAAHLVRQLLKKYPEIQFSGIGGQHLKNAGVDLIIDLASYAVTGFIEVLRQSRILFHAYKRITQHLSETKPDLVILVDYPGFNLRLARFIKEKLDIPILYYISPQIWAWKAKRIKLIKQCVDHMAVILPFEKSIYVNAGVPASFVGHPLVNKIAAVKDKLVQRQALNLPQNSYIIAMLPGSRNNEVERHLPVMIATAKKLHSSHPELQFLIPVAGTLNTAKFSKYLCNLSFKVHLIKGKALECMAAADFVVVASGTASLECALLQKPMCIIYKTSYLSYLIAARFIKVKFIGLCNLLSSKLIVPEFLQEDCNPNELSKFILPFVTNPNKSENMKQELKNLHESLSSESSDCNLSTLVESFLFPKTMILR